MVSLEQGTQPIQKHHAPNTQEKEKQCMTIAANHNQAPRGWNLVLSPASAIALRNLVKRKRAREGVRGGGRVIQKITKPPWIPLGMSTHCGLEVWFDSQCGDTTVRRTSTH